MGLSIGTIDAANGSLTNQFKGIYPVHPQPGKPDHPEWNPLGTQPANQKSFLAKYWRTLSVNGIVYYNLYYLDDIYGNRTYGYSDTQVSTPGSGFQIYTMEFQQSANRPGVPNAYDLILGWYDQGVNQWPSGPYPMNLSVNIPADPPPDHDWDGFTVSWQFTENLSTSSFYAIQQYEGYDSPDQDTQTVNGSQVDLTLISPGAAKTLNGDFVRTPMVLYTGTDLPANPQVLEGQSGDPMIVTDGTDTFDIKLVDSSGNVATDAEIQASLCPRYDHTQASVWSNPTPNVCSDPNLVGQSGTLNAVTASNHGYLGLMVSRAPMRPGPYFWHVASTAGSARTYDRGVNIGGSDQGPLAVMVTGGQFLDENFNPINPYVVDQDTNAYFRYFASQGEALPNSVTITSTQDSGGGGTGTAAVTLNRVMNSSTYLAGPFVLHPPAVPIPTARIQPMTANPTLPVFSPTSTLTATLGQQDAGKDSVIVNGLPIKIDSLYRGAGGDGHWHALNPGERAYLEDGLRLTANLPSGWPIPSAVRWTLLLDDRPYTPPAGVDLTQSVVTLDPIDTAGPFSIHLHATFPGGTVLDSDRPLSVWLETDPSMSMGWIVADDIDTRNYVGTTGTIDGDCTLVFNLQVAVAAMPLTRTIPSIPPELRPFYNAAFLKCIGGSPPQHIDPPAFNNSADYLSYIQAESGRWYKLASLGYFRIPVRLGIFDADGILARLQYANSGATEAKLSANTYGFPSGTITTFPSEQAVDSGQSYPEFLQDTSIDYWLSKARVGVPAQMMACIINAGYWPCDLTHVVPWVWTKLVFGNDTPRERFDLVLTQTSFPTIRFYVPDPANTNQRLRIFPLIQVDGRRFEQSEPNAFLANPEDSNAN